MDKASLLTLNKATGLLRHLLATLRRGGAWLSVCLLFLWSPALAAGSGTAGDPFTTLSDAYAVSSGRYFFNTGSGLFQADVDNSEGGGWVLVLQYVHQGGTNPPLSVLGAGSDFPVTSTAALGADESAITSNWGHAGNLAMSQFAGDIELRWYGQTSGHNRIIHFRTTLGDGYVKTGSGPDNFASLSTNFTALTGHSANIPATTNGIFSNSGNNALTNFPFFQGATAHWGIRGTNSDTPGASGNRWEVDDFPSSAANDTIHRVWVRQTNPLVVTNINDSGEGSLRQAITVANNNAQLDDITFAIPGTGPHVISLASALPVITDDNVSIDGTTQSGASCGNLWGSTPPDIRVQVDGVNPATRGISSSAANTFIKGLSLTGASRGIEFSPGASNSVIECSFLGINPDGTDDGNNYGILTYSSGTRIGGLSAGQGNVISDNAWGLLTQGPSTELVVQGNFIGTDPTGLIARGNDNSGLGNVNGTSTITEIRNNLISANNYGLQFQSDDTWTGEGGADFIIAENYIGTDRTGQAALPNTLDGINFAAGNIIGAVIGGTSLGDRNIISGNGRNGITITGQSDITILGNYIGLGQNGSTNVGNGSDGIRLNGSTSINIGNGTAGGRNVIASNGADGITLEGTLDGVVIDGNYIGLASDGTTARGNGAGYNGYGISFASNTVSDGEIIRNNVIAESGIGEIDILGTVNNLTITGNYIDTDASGNVALNSDYGGIYFGSTGGGHQIGAPGAGNIISTAGGFGQSSALEFSSAVTSATVQANNIGLGANGSTVFGTGSWGIRGEATNLTIGGTGAGEGNTIVGTASGWAGLLIQSGSVATVSGNTIRDGNGYAAVNISNSGTIVTFHDNIVTGDAGHGIQAESGAQLIAYGNTISGNGDDGIFVEPGGQAAIYSNAISANGRLGINLSFAGDPPNGVTVNDAGDGDNGANDLLNFPLINSFAANGSTSVDYDINLDVPGNPDGYRIEFFKNANLETYGEGEVYLGSVDVAHAGGNLNFTGTFTANAVVNTGDYISATTTRKTGAVSFDITSEFAQTATAIAPPSPLIVTSTADTNALGTLRFAINHANANAADDTITFNIPGTGPHVISLTSALPEITDGDVSIDGTTQSGASCGDLWGGTPHTLSVRIDGPSAFNGLNIDADNITVKGLSITGFDSGIVAADGSSVTIQCNYIGIAPDGSAAGQLGDADSQGIILAGSINSLIGGPNATDGNVIGNGAGNGLTLAGGATGLGIQNNFIGTNPAGTAAAPLLDGIQFRSGNYTVSRISDNIISGTTRDGVVVLSSALLSGSLGDLLVQGNYIGVDRTGNAPLSNGRAGWRGNTGSTFNGITFGGGNAGQGNVISANAAQGILLSSGGANLTFLGNNIGVGANGTADLGNGGDGIAIVNATTVLIGNGSTDGRNIIAANGGSGLSLASIGGLTINGNYIGIGGDGSTALGHGSRGITLNSRPAESGIQNAVVTNNIISNNAGGGIDITSGRVAQLGASSAITLTRNTIGLAANGITAAGNGNYGVKNTNVPGAIIVGGIDPADGNTIAHSTGGPGIEVRSEQGTTIAILSNSIFSNDGVSIDLNPGTIDGVTANDNGDPDTGPNDLLNFPLINSFTTNGMTSVDYDINLDVPGNPDGYRIEFFKNTTADPTGHGEGEIYLGFVDVAHAGGNLNFTGNFTANASVSVSDNISATTTRKTGTLSYDITSEFAQNKLAVSNDPAVLSVTKTVDNLVAGEYFLPGNDVVYTFSVVNSGGGSVTADSIVLIDLLPPELTFFNGDHDGTGPSTAVIGFAETGTSLTFNPATDALYSDAAIKPTNLAECDYTPTPGYDPNVTFVCFNPKGEMLGGDPDPNFTLKFRAGIK